MEHHCTAQKRLDIGLPEETTATNLALFERVCPEISMAAHRADTTAAAPPVARRIGRGGVDEAR